MKKSRILAIIMCMVIVVLAFSGCGKSDSENSDTTEPTALSGDLYLYEEKVITRGESSIISITKYDTDGRVVEESRYDSLDSETVSAKTYKYDSKGRLISEEFYNIKYNSDDYSYTVKYTENANGSIGISTEHKGIGFKGYKEMYYDKDNRYIKEVAFDGEETEHIEEYEYHDNGELKRRAKTYSFDVTKTATGETYTASQTVYIYNEKGQLIETVYNNVDSEGLCELRYKEIYTSSSDIPECVAYYVSDMQTQSRACVKEDAEGNKEIQAAWEVTGINEYTLKSYDKYYMDEDYYITITIEDGKIVKTSEKAYLGEFTSTFEYDETTGNLSKISWLKDGKPYCDHEYVWSAK